MKFLATSDIHAPNYIPLLRESLEKALRDVLEGVCIVFLAGDYVDEGKHQFMPLVTRVLEPLRNKPVLAVFGNDDYEEVRDKIRSAASWFRWLDDEEETIEVGGLTVRVFGTMGVLDQPTRWQEKNVPGIRRIYDGRLQRIEEFARERKGDEIRILLTHYSPTYKTLVGEPRFAWPQMGSRRVEKVLEKYGTIDLVVHGHAHKSRVLETRIGKTRVLNVALPARKSIVIDSVSAGPRSLLDFIR